MSRTRINHVTTLLFPPETRGDFVQQFVLFLPPRFQCPGKDLLKMIAVVHGGVKTNHVGAVFRPSYFVLQTGVTVDRQRNGFSS